MASKRILGLSFFYHDSAACLLIDGIPVAMAQEERFSRKKNDSAFPTLASVFVLKTGGISAHDLDYVVFYEKPFIKFERIMKTSLATFPFAPLTFQASIKSLFTDKIWIRNMISKELGVPSEKILFSEHHLSHAASAYYCSPWDEAAILTVDGVGEWATATLGTGKGAKIELLKELHFPHSVGLLYSTFTAFLGFEVNEGEYKVMGMAPYGKPKYVDKVKKLLAIFEDGSLQLNLKYFSFHRSLKDSFSKHFVEIFGKSRPPKSKFSAREQEHYADIAASIQAVTEEIVIGLAKELHRMTGLTKLCMAGGVALNSVANWKILQQTPFDELFIQPAAGDSGGALGAAMVAYHVGLDTRTPFVQNHSYYGAKYSQSEILDALAANNLSNYTIIENEEELLDMVSERLVRGDVIGWFHGRFEWGPRALGARSIIADPRKAEMKDIVNTKIKFREPYRPFAPSVLAEHAHEFFEIDRTSWPGRFMLYVVPVKPEKQSLIPAITHVDGTARPQLVSKEHSPRYAKLIEAFYKKTGVPMVLNTSFNVKGEPIVNSPADAIATFLKSGLDLLVLENVVIGK